MLKFFKNIRKANLKEGKALNYFKYAIGEIILVVIGILIALQINNWNENRKSNLIAKEVYANLLTSLVQDSIEVHRIIDLLSKSVKTQSNLILNESKMQSIKFNQDELDSLIGDILSGVMSFFPKTGVYELITSNNSLDLLKSEQIKSLLINLYDFQYKRYENIDALLDHKYHNELNSLIREKIKLVGTFNSETEFTILSHADYNRFKEHYEELVSECRDSYGMLSTANAYLIQIRQSIEELIELIRVELNE